LKNAQASQGRGEGMSSSACTICDGVKELGKVVACSQEEEEEEGGKRVYQEELTPDFRVSGSRASPGYRLCTLRNYMCTSEMLFTDIKEYFVCPHLIGVHVHE
jgi:hypothetical protein